MFSIPKKLKLIANRQGKIGFADARDVVQVIQKEDCSIQASIALETTPGAHNE